MHPREAITVSIDQNFFRLSIFYYSREEIRHKSSHYNAIYENNLGEPGGTGEGL